VGRSVHIFIDQLLSLEKSKLVEQVTELETLVGNPISIRLCDTDGKNYYLGDESGSVLTNQSSVSVLATQDQEEEKKGDEA